MSFPLRTALALVFCLPLLAACSGTPTIRANNQGPDSPDYAGEAGSGLDNYGSLTGKDSLFSFGTAKSRQQDNGNGGGGAGIGVNAYLWRGALDTLAFMPLSSADPFSGVIITDWYSPPSVPTERFKATAYVMGRDLRSDGVRVAIFRQVMQNGQWVDASISPMTVGEIEDKVLARARQLREQSQAQS
ncbi:MAG TPA: DUF3576 domain-containing protein [Acetobacteraceae bacterium]|nr:DUF3576 domain-containing protein [Acetobacteraceae bacterium]